MECKNAEDAAAPTDTTPLLVTMPTYAPNKSSIFDELSKIRICLKWCALDHSSPARKLVSCLAFLLFAFAVPASTTLYFSSPTATAEPITFNQLVKLPETVLATISFLTLADFFRHHGLHQLLLVDDALRDDSASVRNGYSGELNRVFRYLAYILLPAFSVELLHKVLLFSAVPLRVPHLWTVAMAATLASWVYRTGVFLLVCVFFRLTCELQILRFEGFYKMFEGEGSEEGHECLIFKEHLRIKRLLLVISHRYRIFIIGCLVTITISQLGALMLVLTSKTKKDFRNSGDIVVCSVVQLTGFLMCLLGAARITHRAQKVVSIASRWHMTLASTPYTKPDAVTGEKKAATHTNNEPDLSEQTSPPPPSPHGTSTFDSRQALVMYLQHNGGGITIFGFALDRGLLHTIFVFEMTLVLWMLGKVVVLS